MSTSPAVARPFVVLLGWLGCQPKNLRRYESLYRGFDILSHIATPAQIVRATLTLPPPNDRPLPWPRTWPYSHSRSASNNNVLQCTTVEDLAWEILAEMDASDAPVFFLHIFSNGGAFVWEAVVTILNQSHAFPGPIRQRLLSLEQRVAGVVIDSAPGMDFDRLPDALAWVSWQEKVTMLGQVSPWWMYRWWRNWNTPAAQTFFQQRRECFLDTWTQTPVVQRLPMLFLYAQNDALCSPTEIAQMVQTLSHAKGKCWEDSIHCGHLLRHPQEYHEAVTQFVQTHLKKADQAIARPRL